MNIHRCKAGARSIKGIMRICSYYFIVDISLHIVPFVPDKFLNYNPSITFYPVLMLKNNVTLDEVKVIWRNFWKYNSTTCTCILTKISLKLKISHKWQTKEQPILFVKFKYDMLRISVLKLTYLSLWSSWNLNWKTNPAMSMFYWRPSELKLLIFDCKSIHDDLTA